MADPYESFQRTILIGKESTWGTPVAATKDVGLVQSIDVQESNNLRNIGALGTRTVQSIIAGAYEATISLKIKFQHGRLLEYLFGGTVTHSATDTPDIKHTFTEADALPSFTLEDSFNTTSDVTKTFAGCKVNEATLRLGLDGELEGDFSIFAKTVATGTSASAAVISTLPVMPHFWATVKTGALSSEVTQAQVQNLSITIRNGLERVMGLGTRLPQYFAGGMRNYEFSFDIAFQNKTDYELFLGSTAPSATSTPTVPSVIFDISNAVALASGRRQFYIALTNASFNQFGEASTIGKSVIASFKGQATAIASCYTYDNIVSGSW